MNTTVATKFQVGLKAAGRALLPVLVVILGLVQTGVVHNWRDLLRWDNLMAILGAAGLKGLVSGLTAKPVTLLP